jgi:ribosomal protein S18 acetylase RimI-like enzyme
VIEFARPEDAPAVTRIINAAYHAGETDIWRSGWTRTSQTAVEALIAAGEIAVARADGDGDVVGSVRVRRLDDETAELGMLSVDPEAFGTGAGRALLTFAEQQYGTPFMQLELLVPRGAAHPQKERLHAWYSRLGYRQISAREFEEPLLAGPADLRTYRKNLRAAPAT